MRTLIKLILVLCFSSTLFNQAMAELPDLKLTGIEDELIPLKKFSNQVILVVNTASECGFTPQYRDLQLLFEKYQAKGFTILGFPSNDFGGQDPGSNAEIKKFCTMRFQVSFPLFAKGVVKSEPNQQEFFKLLTTDKMSLSKKSLTGDIKWNFEKFLIDRDGNLRYRFGSYVNPMSGQVTSKVEKLLQETK